MKTYRRTPLISDKFQITDEPCEACYRRVSAKSCFILDSLRALAQADPDFARAYNRLNDTTFSWMVEVDGTILKGIAAQIIDDLLLRFTTHWWSVQCSKREYARRRSVLASLQFVESA